MRSRLKRARRPCARGLSVPRRQRRIAQVVDDRPRQRVAVGRRNQAARRAIARPVRRSAPTRVATTGKPQAIASRIVLETPSASDGSTKQSSPCSSGTTSRRSPANHASSRTPASARRSSTCRRNDPSPTNTSRMRCRASGWHAQRVHERPREVGRVLHRFHPPDGAHQPVAGSLERAPFDRAPAAGRRREARRVDAVVDLVDLSPAQRRRVRARYRWRSGDSAT